MRIKKWSQDNLIVAAAGSTSIRQVIKKLGLKPAGGNYRQIEKFLSLYQIDTKHFKGRGWKKGVSGTHTPRIPLEQILKKDSNFQSFKLKNRLFLAGLKQPHCEECGWARKSVDGRLPLELDHINGNSKDNRLKNLKILCPNCHSLKATHRGLNSKKR